MAATTRNQTRTQRNGDKLFEQREFLGAWYLYAEAMRMASSTPSLYASCAACWFHLKRYYKASQDAQKAISMAPTYTRAWIILAKCQSSLYDSANLYSWSRVFSTLSSPDLKPDESVLLNECRVSLRSWRATREVAELLVSEESDAGSVLGDPSYSPAACAAAMRPALHDLNVDHSSAWVVGAAHMDFTEGLNTAKVLRQHLDHWRSDYLAASDGLTYLTEGLLWDRRAVPIDENSDEVIRLIIDQMCWQVSVHDVAAWVERGSEFVSVDAPGRLKAHGWPATRRALSTTVRTWVIRAFLAGAAHREYDSKVDLLEQAIAVLQFGRERWADVPASDRGMMFERTFLNGVNAMYFEALMECWQAHHANGTSSSFKTLSRIWAQLSNAPDTLIREIAADPCPSARAPAFILAFERYPLALAYFTKAFLYASTRESQAKGQTLWAKFAEQNYLRAADLYPEDDELHTWSLRCALRCLWAAGAPLRRTLPLAERIRLASPKMLRIWRNSPMAARHRREAELEEVLSFERAAWRGIERRRYDMDTELQLMDISL